MLQRRWRRLLLAFVGIALPLSAFSELAEEIHEADPLGFDEPLLRWAEASASPSLDQAMLLASELGYAWGVVPLAVLVFAGLTAFDTQNIKATYIAHAQAGDQEWLGKAAIMGALNLYLDFINMFMFLLQFMGNRE